MGVYPPKLKSGKFNAFKTGIIHNFSHNVNLIYLDDSMSINRRTILKSSILLATPLQALTSIEVPQMQEVKSMSSNDFWHSIRTEFPMDRTMINLNNGGVSPSPRSVMQALHTEFGLCEPSAGKEYLAAARTWFGTCKARGSIIVWRK